MTTVDPRGILLPCKSREWDIKNADSIIPAPGMKYDDAMATLWSGTPVRVSEFGLRVLATSVFLEIWQSQHGHDSWLTETWRERHYVVLDSFHDQISRALDVPPYLPHSN